MFIHKHTTPLRLGLGQRALKHLYVRATYFSYILQQDRVWWCIFHQCFTTLIKYRMPRKGETNQRSLNQVHSLLCELFLSTIIFPDQVNLLVVGTVAKTLQTINCSRSNRRESLWGEPLSRGIFSQALLLIYGWEKKKDKLGWQGAQLDISNKRKPHSNQHLQPTHTQLHT